MSLPRIHNCAYEIKLLNSNFIGNSDIRNIQFNIVRRVCQILGLNNSFDTSIIIRRDVIIPYYEEIYDGYMRWERIFKFRCKRPNPILKENIQYFSVLRAVIKSWNGHKLTRTGNNGSGKYKLISPNDNFMLLVENYKFMSDLSVQRTLDITINNDQNITPPNTTFNIIQNNLSLNIMSSEDTRPRLLSLYSQAQITPKSITLNKT